MSFVCSICADSFLPSSDTCVTKCGHLFHYLCIIQWLEHQQTCPQCRQNAQENDLVRVFPNFEEMDDAMKLKRENDELQMKLVNLKMKESEHKKRLANFQQTIESLKNERIIHEQEKQRCKEEISKKCSSTIRLLQSKLNDIEIAFEITQNGDLVDFRDVKRRPLNERVLYLRRKLQEIKTENDYLMEKYNSVKNKYHNYRSLMKNCKCRKSSGRTHIHSRPQEIHEPCDTDWNRIISTSCTPSVEPVTYIILDE